MATIKSYSDLQQSKVLAEILPLESADMYYQYVLPKYDKIKHNPEIGNPVNALKWYNKGYTTFGKEPVSLDEYCVPCWSLASLLGVLPNIIKGVHFKTLSFLYEWHCAYINGNGEILTFDTSADNPVDACVDMIIKLSELNLL